MSAHVEESKPETNAVIFPSRSSPNQFRPSISICSKTLIRNLQYQSQLFQLVRSLSLQSKLLQWLLREYASFFLSSFVLSLLAPARSNPYLPHASGSNARAMRWWTRVTGSRSAGTTRLSGCLLPPLKISPSLKPLAPDSSSKKSHSAILTSLITVLVIKYIMLQLSQVISASSDRICDLN